MDVFYPESKSSISIETEPKYTECILFNRALFLGDCQLNIILQIFLVIPSRMVLLIHPDSALFQRSHILSEDSELDNASPETPRTGGDDDVSLPLLGRSQSYNLPVGFPLRYQETVAPVDEDPNLPGNQSKMI